jgi:hypothetical protein
MTETINDGETVSVETDHTRYSPELVLDGTLTLDGTYSLTAAESSAAGLIEVIGTAQAIQIGVVESLQRRTEYDVQGTGLVDD